MDNVIILVSDDSDDDVMTVANAAPASVPASMPEATPASAPGTTTTLPPTSAPDLDSNALPTPGRVIAKIQPTEILPMPIVTFEDDEIEITSVSNNRSKEGKRVTTDAVETRTDLECIPIGERQGIRPNRDYPHFRFSCDTHPFKKVRARTKEMYCEQCYCYICDVLASECTKWSSHCKVVDNQRYKRERDAVLNERKRRQLCKDEGRCTILKRITRPQRVDDREYELLVELPNDDEEFEDDGCPHSGSEDDQSSMPIDFDDGHLILPFERIRNDDKNSELQRSRLLRMLKRTPETESYVSFRRGVSAYADLL